MGSIAPVPNGAGEPSRQNYSSFSAYTNGDGSHKWNSSQYPDDRISHGDGTASRPVSQGVVSSSSNPSRPTTSQGASSSTATTNGTQGQARPGSNGTDVAQPPAMRHGFAEAYSSEEYLTMLEQVSPQAVVSDAGVLYVFHI
jgi:hypothetical protein